MCHFTDLIYYLSLLTCMSLGSYYKKIEDKEIKRNYGAGLGILITCLICGQYTVHSILMVWGNIVIIKCCDKRYMHHMSLAYTWIYLVYLRWNIDSTVYVLWLHQTISLRLVGLAFELCAPEKGSRPSSSSKVPSFRNTNLSIKSDHSKDAHPKTQQSSSEKTVTGAGKHSIPKMTGDYNSGSSEPSAIEIIAYAYYFIGLHKGPYYRWKTFNEHFRTPFGILGDCRIITEQKLKKAFICTIIFTLLQIKFPVSVYDENDFYVSYGTDFRYLYNIPQMLTYVLQYQMVMFLCSAVCTETGFGVYPTKTLPLPGHGPTTRFSLLDLAIAKEEVALQQEFNFAMLKSFENEKLVIGPRMRDTLRGWDMSIRYWFWAHTYKNIVSTSKEARSALSFLAWTIWCGPTIQQLIISSTLWVHLHLENEYGELYDTNLTMKMPWDIGFSIMRMFCLIYLTPCLILNDSSVVLHYYHSIFWVYHMVLFCLILGALCVNKDRYQSASSGNEDI
ncbi:unnamed protein product [Chrysodeixis includens]|uniref:Lysophospholipid acyltransferase 7 n=1 Tax=Chrysodeixis includens TaxID=689277 RepID=A0A9P0BP05_CHRIL|nr:unnamed protein product [Chrysodeixis includens]